MLFGNHTINTEVKIVIDNESVERVYENTFLGVVLGHKLRSIGILSKPRSRTDIHRTLCTAHLFYHLCVLCGSLGKYQ